MHVYIIGAGAAGCFAAIHIKQRMPNVKVTVLEAASRPLSKVMITGGGRCNVTNSFVEVSSLERIYPRGHRLMKRLFHTFSPKDTYSWWEENGVALVTQSDQCVFPRSQRAGEIVDTLLRMMKNLNVELICHQRIAIITPAVHGFELRNSDGDSYLADKVLICIGGVQRKDNEEMILHCPLKMESPLPSLFSFKLPNHPITALMGLVVEEVVCSIAGTKFRAQGALLITHWGMSGPAILKLSAYAARYLAEKEYRCSLHVNWMQGTNEEEIEKILTELCSNNPQKMIHSVHPPYIHRRLWEQILYQAEIKKETRWSELNQKMLNRIIHNLTNSQYNVEGKNPFKEEFVTCGGVALSEIDNNTLEHKTHRGLYLAGEVLDVDAITGGYNLQAAWTMGYVAAKSITTSLSKG